MTLEKKSWTRRKQVSEHDPAVLEIREKSKKIYRGKPGYFDHALWALTKARRKAELLLEENNAWQERIASSAPEFSEEKSALESRIAHNREELASIKNKAEFGLRIAFQELLLKLSQPRISSEGFNEEEEYVRRELAYMYDTPEILQSLSKVFGDIQSLSYADFLRKVTDGSVPITVLEEMATRHEKKRLEQETKLHELFETAKKDFRACVLNAVSHGWLPQEASAALTRLAHCTVSLRDGLNDGYTVIMGGAEHLGHITISDKRLGEANAGALRKTLFHEFLHIISGVSISVSSPPGENEWQTHSVKHRKSGISLHSKNRRTSYGNWLNEATTEWLALKLSGYSADTRDTAFLGSSSYAEERRVLFRLFEQGLDEQSVLNAYFENFTTDIPVTERGKYFAELMHRINELTDDPHLFTRIENEHVLDSIERYLLNSSFYPYNDRNQKYLEEHPELKRMIFTLSIGNRDGQISRKFCVVAQDLEVGNEIITADSQLSKARTRLDTVLRHHDARVRIVE